MCFTKKIQDMVVDYFSCESFNDKYVVIYSVAVKTETVT